METANKMTTHVRENETNLMLSKEEETLYFNEMQKALTANNSKVSNYYRDQIVKSNQRLVAAIATQYRGRGLDLDDLKQIGNEGLMKAIEKFDSSLGNRFSTYATYWIKQSIELALYNESEAIRVPVHFKKLLYKVNRVKNGLASELGRTPTVEELAVKLNMTVEDVENCLAYTNSTTSLNRTIGDDEESSMLDLVGSDERTPEQKYHERAKLEMLHSLVSDLPEREKYVIIGRFGLDGGTVLTLEQIGKALNVSHERVRQIERKALGMLKARALNDQAFLLG